MTRIFTFIPAALTAVAALMLGGARTASAQTFTFNLDSFQERAGSPLQANNSTALTGAAGVGSFSLTGNTLTINLSTRNLAADISGAHIHIVSVLAPGGLAESTGPVSIDFVSLATAQQPGFTVVGSAAAFTFPTMTATLSQAQIDGIFQNRAYFNVHNPGTLVGTPGYVGPNSNFAGGQIRANIVVAPEPGTVALIALGALPMMGIAIRRRK